MRKWIFLLGLFVIIYLLTVSSSKRAQEKSSFLKRFKETISILAWTLATVYILAFLYLLYNMIFK
jgi:hypothetical protein